MPITRCHSANTLWPVYADAVKQDSSSATPTKQGSHLEARQIKRPAQGYVRDEASVTPIPRGDVYSIRTWLFLRKLDGSAKHDPYIDISAPCRPANQRRQTPSLTYSTNANTPSRQADEITSIELEIERAVNRRKTFARIAQAVERDMKNRNTLAYAQYLAGINLSAAILISELAKHYTYSPYANNDFKTTVGGYMAAFVIAALAKSEALVLKKITVPPLIRHITTQASTQQPAISLSNQNMSEIKNDLLPLLLPQLEFNCIRYAVVMGTVLVGFGPLTMSGTALASTLTGLNETVATANATTFDPIDDTGNMIPYEITQTILATLTRFIAGALILTPVNKMLKMPQPPGSATINGLTFSSFSIADSVNRRHQQFPWWAQALILSAVAGVTVSLLEKIRGRIVKAGNWVSKHIPSFIKKL